MADRSEQILKDLGVQPKPGIIGPPEAISQGGAGATAPDPNKFGPGFFEFPFNVRGGQITPKPIIEQAMVGVGNIRRMQTFQRGAEERQAAKFQRTLPLDLAVKGPLTAFGTQLGRGLKRFGKRPSVAGFIVGGMGMDAVGELMLQQAEVSLGLRDKISRGEVMASSLITAAVAGGGAIATKMIARIGNISGRSALEAAFSNPIRQFRLLFPRAFSSKAARSAEFELAGRIERTVRRVLKPGDVGVYGEHAMTVTAVRNAQMLKQATDSGAHMVDVRPTMTKAMRLAESLGKVKQKPNKGTIDELVEFAADIEEKFAARGFKATPSEWNGMLKNVNTPLEGAFDKALIQIDPSNSVRNKMFLQVAHEMNVGLKKTMDTFSRGAFSQNAAATKQLLDNAEKMSKQMGDKARINFVRSVHSRNNEALLNMLNEFDKLNGTNFVEDTFELSMNRNLTVDQEKRIQGLARTVAPFLVLMRQAATKIAIPLTRPATIAAGSLTSGAIRSSKQAEEFFRQQIDAGKRSAPLNIPPGGRTPADLDIP